ncbi:MAG: hypothetical protein ABIH66_09505, partial [bacterium]
YPLVDFIGALPAVFKFYTVIVHQRHSSRRAVSRKKRSAKPFFEPRAFRPACTYSTPENPNIYFPVFVPRL